MKPRTKAQVYGFNTKAMAKRARRVADRARQQLSQVAYDWSDIDNTVASGVDALCAAFDEFEQQIKDAVELLNEPYEDNA